jgi:hypothetical protein
MASKTRGRSGVWGGPDINGGSLEGVPIRDAAERFSRELAKRVHGRPLEPSGPIIYDHYSEQLGHPIRFVDRVLPPYSRGSHDWRETMRVVRDKMNSPGSPTTEEMKRRAGRTYAYTERAGRRVETRKERAVARELLPVWPILEWAYWRVEAYAANRRALSREITESGAVWAVYLVAVDVIAGKIRLRPEMRSDDRTELDFEQRVDWDDSYKPVDLDVALSDDELGLVIEEPQDAEGRLWKMLEDYGVNTREEDGTRRRELAELVGIALCAAADWKDRLEAFNALVKWARQRSDGAYVDAIGAMNPPPLGYFRSAHKLKRGKQKLPERNDEEAIRLRLEAIAAGLGWNVEQLLEQRGRGRVPAEVAAEFARRRDVLALGVADLRRDNYTLEAIGAVIGRTKARVLDLERHAARSCPSDPAAQSELLLRRKR